MASCKCEARRRTHMTSLTVDSGLFPHLSPTMGTPTANQPLSNNWQKLQKQLESSKPPAQKKRKVSDRVDCEDTPESMPAANGRPGWKSLRHGAGGNCSPDENFKFKSVSSSSERRIPNRRDYASSASATAAEPELEVNAVSASLALWAEDNDIPAADLARAYYLPLTISTIPNAASASRSSGDPSNELEPIAADANKTEVGKYIAIDCEMVGVGERGHESSALARVSVVNFHGHCLLDVFVKPKEMVTDWRTWVSGVSPKDMEHAITFEEAQKMVADLMDGRILVGHAVKNDLDCLLIGHPRRDIRDTSRHPDFRKRSKGRTPGLKKLAKEILGIDIQGGSHSSVEDARACMQLYRRFKEDFERQNQINFPNKAKKQDGGKKNKRKK